MRSNVLKLRARSSLKQKNFYVWEKFFHYAIDLLCWKLVFLFCFVLHFYYNSSSHIKSGKKVSQLRTEEKLIFGSSLLFRLQSSLHKKLPSMATPRPPYFLLDVPETVRQIQCVLRHFVITTHFEIIYA